MLKELDLAKLKSYCCFASAAKPLGRLGGGLGGGLGGKCFEKWYQALCEEFDHQIGIGDKIGMRVGQTASIPAGCLVGGKVAHYVAGFQSVSMLGPVKSQLCAAISGCATGFIVAVAITGASTAIGFQVEKIVRETQTCWRLAEVARERRQYLEGYVQQIQTSFSDRLSMIASDIDRVGLGISDLKMALERGVGSEEEVLHCMWFAPTAKLALDQILAAIDTLQQDVIKHYKALKKELSRDKYELERAIQDKEAAQPQDDENTVWRSLFSAPFALLAPATTLAWNSVNIASWSFRTIARGWRISALERAIDAVQDTLRKLQETERECVTLRRRAKALQKELNSLLSQLSPELERLVPLSVGEVFQRLGQTLLLFLCMLLFVSTWLAVVVSALPLVTLLPDNQAKPKGEAISLEGTWLSENLLWAEEACSKEPTAGSDVANLKCAAKLEGDHYIMDGEKKRLGFGEPPLCTL